MEKEEITPLDQPITSVVKCESSVPSEEAPLCASAASPSNGEAKEQSQHGMRYHIASESWKPCQADCTLFRS